MSAPSDPPSSASSRGTRVHHRILAELGLTSVWQSPRDVKLLCAQRFVRLFAYGGSTLILAAYLSALDISDERIGLFMTLTLVGDVAISFLLTLFADAMGRRAVLALGSALMVGSGILFASVGNYWVLLAAAVFGVISPSGNEIGPFRAVEESTLAHLTPKEILSDIFAWYSLIGNAGTALGMMTGGWAINLLQVIWGWPYIPACRVIFFAYAAIGALKFLLSIALSSAVEAEKKKPAQRSSSEGERQPLLGDQTSNAAPQEQPPQKKKSILSFLGDSEVVSLFLRLAILFALDSFASGLASLSWMTYFFKRKFSLPEGSLGSIFFTTSLISAASVLVASSIAKRIGNVKTMVFTHLPSAICLALIPVPSVLPLALTFLVLRACSQTMDVAPRSAFLAAALPPDRRTAIMGSINVVKTCAQSLGPLLTGILADRGVFGLSFTIAGILKAVYDIGMLLSFAGKEKQQRRPAPRDEDEEAA
ncbi:MFS general substrate transporter [Aspergillus costaricaensis CBS 115574]|uniref:MFS general substrate transporter n=1 Tax=Aspergillus costaricaensis CBS 115574 TaxID=1448317 RepID=A0ACD1I2L1_9EURO|nr:MFS general substrate transporter [Aspergillus costaricaensis CBS 115574]RAK83998.1 MFS general substrate transporter [Aspergillus costaricaensis CBS 115574]